jgi:hypothetical protein
MSRTTPIQETITVHVPFTIRKRGGRKQIITPDAATGPRAHIDNTLLKALARAFRWQRMLENGAFTTIGDLAIHEGIAPSYMTRVMRLTLLTPEIVSAIVEGRQGPEITLAGLLEPFPGEWAGQCAMLGGNVTFRL